MRNFSMAYRLWSSNHRIHVYLNFNIRFFQQFSSGSQRHRQSPRSHRSCKILALWLSQSSWLHPKTAALLEFLRVSNGKRLTSPDDLHQQRMVNSGDQGLGTQFSIQHLLHSHLLAIVWLMMHPSSIPASIFRIPTVVIYVAGKDSEIPCKPEIMTNVWQFFDPRKYINYD